jgi:hypothetical protein
MSSESALQRDKTGTFGQKVISGHKSQEWARHLDNVTLALILDSYLATLEVFPMKPHFICNLYIYIQQTGVRVECHGLGKCTCVVIRV